MELPVSHFVDRVQAKVRYCLSCQPRDSGEWVWIQGDRIGLDTLLGQLGVPEELWASVAEQIQWPSCGTSGFDFDDDVGLQTEEEFAHEERWESWAKEYSQDVTQFWEHLAQFPYLGLAHPVGQKLSETVGQLPSICLPQDPWWRARKPIESKPLTIDDMKPPSTQGPRSEGRFNHFGQAVYYLSSTAEAAALEVVDHRLGGIAWVLEVRLPRLDGILDLRIPDWWNEARFPLLALGIVSKMTREAPERDAIWRPEYFVPRFIADCAKADGRKGVLFHSPRHMEENLVLFGWDSTKIEYVDEPRIIQVSPVTCPF